MIPRGFVLSIFSSWARVMCPRLKESHISVRYLVCVCGSTKTVPASVTRKFTRFILPCLWPVSNKHSSNMNGANSNATIDGFVASNGLQSSLYWPNQVWRVVGKQGSHSGTLAITLVHGHLDMYGRSCRPSTWSALFTIFDLFDLFDSSVLCSYWYNPLGQEPWGGSGVDNSVLIKGICEDLLDVDLYFLGI